MRNDNNGILYALIAEGGSEQAVLEILIENNLLVFPKEQIFKEQVLRTRAASSFQKKHLQQGLGNTKLIVYRILDSRGENFNLSAPYRNKVQEVIDLLTRPEFEMLFIIHFNDYASYRRVSSRMNPSDFAKEKYAQRVGNVKSREDVFAFWNDRPQDLVAAIREYARLSPDGIDNTLASILR